MPASKEYVIEKLERIGNYLEILGENPFKTRAYFRSADSLSAEEESDLGRLIQTGRLGLLDGIGGALKEKIIDIYETGTCAVLEKLEEQVPEGVGALLKIKGLGPKKIAHVWQKMGLTSPGELLYACQENRLSAEKGFGIKTQDSIRRSIEFHLNQSGMFHYNRMVAVATRFLEIANEKLPVGANISFTGELRRKVQVLSQGEILCETEQAKSIINDIVASEEFELIEQENHSALFKMKDSRMKIALLFPEGNYFLNLLQSTGSESHLNLLGTIPPNDFQSETELFASLHLQFIEPEMREGKNEIDLARNHKLPQLVEFGDLKGMLHNHSTWSDGLHTLEEMAKACIDLGLDYFGISDHSQSAAYANGLSQGRIEQQQIEVDKLNKKLAPFRILKGIESDILTDGSLDYPESVLKTFDFVVASVHSGMNMDEEKATARLLKAIENPYTNILGHPTGRLLLSREGYPINHKKIIDACAANGVSIEINANPYRLDIDWEWIPYCIEKNVMISINPDAHKKAGLLDAHWGIASARKGGLTAAMTLNALPLEELLSIFSKRRNVRT